MRAVDGGDEDADDEGGDVEGDDRVGRDGRRAGCHAEERPTTPNLWRLAR